MIKFFVPGTPIPQGSKVGYVRGTRAVVVDSNKDKLQSWRADVTAVAQQAMRDAEQDTITGPAVVTMEFMFARPKSHYRTGKFAHLLRDNAPTLHTQKPDIDKLERAIFDALTAAGVWRDDSQAAEVHKAKRWAERSGALIAVKIP